MVVVLICCFRGLRSVLVPFLLENSAGEKEFILAYLPRGTESSMVQKPRQQAGKVCQQEQEGG